MLAEVENLAREEARRLQHKYIRTEHLLLALLRLTHVQTPISYEAANIALQALRYPTCGAEEKLIFAEGAKRAMAHAQHLAGDEEVSAEHLLEGILAYSPIVRKIFSKPEETKHE